MRTQKMIFAGFGGQGVLLIGQMIAYAGMFEGKEVTFMPSYGPEMRGGTANCTVIVSDKTIACPIADSITTLVAMNYPSLVKFAPMVEPGGDIFLNASLIPENPDRQDVKVHRVDATALALELGNAKCANIVMLGAILAETGVVSRESIERVMEEKAFTGRKAQFLPLNKKALAAWKA